MKYRIVMVKNAVMIDSKMDGYSVLRLLERNHEHADINYHMYWWL